MTEQCSEHDAQAMPASNALYGRTDGRTNEEQLSPTRDQETFVTRGRAYGNFSINSGTPLATYLEAKVILTLIGPDPDAAIHAAELRRALGGHCIFTDCPNPHHGGGMCRRHYDKFQRTIIANEAFRINRRAS